MDKYIQALLALNKSVILPEFGALSMTNEETGEAMFNAYLKFNDGKLEKYIAEQEGIDIQDAANMVAKYVRDLELLLNKGETYDIFQFGRFVKLSDGSFDFENWTSFNQEGSSTYVSPKKEHTDSPVITDEKEVDNTTKAEENTESPVKKERITEEEISSIKEVYEKPAERTLSEEEKKQSQNKFIPVEPTPQQEIKESDDQSAKEKTPKKEKEKVKKTNKKSNDTNKKKRGLAFYLVITFCILLGATATLIGIFPEEAKQLVGWVDISNENNTRNETPNTTDIDLANEDSIDDEEFYDEDDITDEIIDGLTNTQNSEPVSPASTNPGGSFHIIVGSFGEQQNAENLANTLKSKGYPASIIGPVNNLHMVSISSYNSRSTAQENLQKAIDETGGGWILKRD